MTSGADGGTVGPAGEKPDSLAGLGYAFGAYFMWGVFPFYFKLLAHVPAVEVVLHRTVWSLPVAGLALLLLRRTADLRTALRTPRTLLMALVTSVTIASNWGIYIWAVATDHLLEAALGYYINPLVNVAVGALLLGERLTRAQLFAVGLAIVAVSMLSVSTGGVPWVSILLALTFSGYGFLRKTLPIGPSQGFFLEVLILSIPAVMGIAWLGFTGAGHFTLREPMDLALLLGCGVITTVPLLMFGFAARMLRFTTIGLMQYVTPTIVFLIAVFVFDEPFDRSHGLAFALIWSALAIYTGSMFRKRATA